MNIRPECVSCLLGRVLFQAKLADNGSEFRSVESALRTFAKEFREGRNSASVATEVHRSAYKAMGVSDPYLELKKRADVVAEEYLPRAEAFIEKSNDRLKAAVLMAAIGNIMDFGAGIAIDHPDKFGEEFDRMVAQGIGSDDTEKMRGLIKKGSRIVYIFDNCGESLLDALLIKEFQNLGARVIGVVRGEPILNDITMEDAERSGLKNVPDRMLTTGQFAIGIDLGRIGDELKKEISDADLIVAKGMANFESLSDEKMKIPIVYILRSKCRPVADALGMPLDTNVIRFVV